MHSAPEVRDPERPASRRGVPGERASCAHWRASHPVTLALAALLVLTQSGAGEEERRPYYVGARVCGTCHEGRAMGSQLSLWLLSKHSKAYAALSLPEAAPIAALSGIPGDPRKSQNCLSCHATGSAEEPWEKDPAFALEDGVQCEQCHGPGSEYMDEAVMRNRDAAVKAGLRIPTERDCMLCHYVKGSHVAIHKLPQMDPAKGLQVIAHPKPEDPVTGSPPRVGEGLREGSRPGARYAGALACGKCHDLPTRSCGFSKWRMGPHAQAYAVLATPPADAIAERAGVEGDPQRSPSCLECHATASGAAPVLSSYSIDEGVGCEACHGAGGDYMIEAIMRDGPAARAAGLAPLTRETCLRCHAGGHGPPFDVDAALQKMRQGPRASADPLPLYKTPVNLAMSPDGREIYVACEASSSVVVVELASRRKVEEIQVGGQPADVTFSPDGARAYVSNRLDDSVSVIDTASRAVTATLSVGDEPHGLHTDASGRRLFVLNTAADSISVIDTEALTEIRRLASSRNPWSLALSGDGSRLLVTNNLSRFVEFRTPSISEVTEVDARGGIVSDRHAVPGANLIQGVAWRPDGELALFTLNRTKNLVPMTRIQQGWTITNGLGVLWRDGRVDQVLLDEPGQYFPDPTDVAFTPDGRLALVTSSGSDRVAVVDVEKLIALIRWSSAAQRERTLPNHLGKSADFVLRYVETKSCPRGIAVAPDGSAAFVANSLDDSLTVIDLAKLEAVDRVDLGGPAEITKVRFGERLFNNARITFQRQFSCHSCHPDGHVDGLAYDIEADGIGFNPVDNRTLRGILDTDPFKWAGTNPSLSRQCGARLAVFFTRLAPFSPEELAAVDNYVCTIPRPPNRYRPVGAALTEAQRRGKRIFERSRTNDGRLIPPEGRCSTCHNPPLYTDRSKRKVGTQLRLDLSSEFDVPHLNNIYDSAPYLHDGISSTLEEIWTRYNPRDEHGVTNDMTKDQLNDLIEYLRTL